MAPESRLERWLDRQLARTMTPRGAAVVIASVSTGITLLAGLVMTVVDHQGFPSIGSGLWWAVQTVTTVGYGDHVPRTAAGQFIAAVVMLLGVGFVTVITASITSSFVTRSRSAQPVAEDGVSLAEEFRKIDERLERIETALRNR